MAGYTTGDVSWTLRLLPTAQGCRLIDARVRLQVLVTMPRWPTLDAAPVPLRRDWRHMLAALQVHEDGHLALVRDTAARVRGVIAAAGDEGAMDCEAFRQPIDAAVEQAIREGAARNRDYDLRTHHGRDEGVHLGD